MWLLEKTLKITIEKLAECLKTRYLEATSGVADAVDPKPADIEKTRTSQSPNQRPSSSRSWRSERRAPELV